MVNASIRISAVLVALLLACGGGGGPSVQQKDSGPDRAEHLPDAVDIQGGGEEVQPPCLLDQDCDDHNPCTIDTCTEKGCQYEPIVSGPCDDGDPCTEADFCDNGICRGGTFVCQCEEEQDCPPASDPCHYMTCDKDEKKCVLQTYANGTPCDDKDPCTEGEACWDGECSNGKKICECKEDSDCPQGADECSPLVCDLNEHKCKVLKKEDDAPCDDKDPCTTESACKDGVCTPKAYKECDDQDPCTKDYCDKESGECVFEYEAKFGCCEKSSDCDDGDECTKEECVGHKCMRYGEPVEDICATVDGCNVGFCDEATGLCRSLDLSLPAVLFDWDFSQGKMPSGAYWTREGGSLEGGLGPAPGYDLVSFAFPAHFVAPGVLVLNVVLAEGLDCSVQSKVLLKVQGKAGVLASSCGVFGTRTVLGFPIQWPNNERLALEVLVEQGARIERLTLYLWATKSCKPLGPAVVVSGIGSSDLSVASSPSQIGLGFRFHPDTIKFAYYSLFSGVKNQKEPASKKMESKSAMHRTSLISLGPSRWLFAYDGLPDGATPTRIEVALLDDKGEVVARTFVPRSLEKSYQAEPFLALTPSGKVILAYTTDEADSSGSGIAIREVIVTDNKISFGPVKTVNNVSEGDQTLPSLAYSSSSGVAAWRGYLSSDVPPSSVRIRKLNESSPEGLGYEVLKSNEPIQSLSVAIVGDYYFVAATTLNGNLLGYRVKSDFSESTKWKDIPQGFWSDVSLIGALDRALLVGTRLLETEARVVQVEVSKLGQVGALKVLSSVVTKPEATPSTGPFGPFMSLVAYNDTLGDPKGVKVRLVSPLCPSGPSYCGGDGKSYVCTGLGASGYAELSPVADWCIP